MRIISRTESLQNYDHVISAEKEGDETTKVSIKTEKGNVAVWREKETGKPESLKYESELVEETVVCPNCLFATENSGYWVGKQCPVCRSDREMKVYIAGDNHDQ